MVYRKKIVLCFFLKTNCFWKENSFVIPLCACFPLGASGKKWRRCRAVKKKEAPVTMGKDKEGDLWDDSALISAFDDAMSKYKVPFSYSSPALYTLRICYLLRDYSRGFALICSTAGASCLFSLWISRVHSLISVQMVCGSDPLFFK